MHWKTVIARSAASTAERIARFRRISAAALWSATKKATDIHANSLLTTKQGMQRQQLVRSAQMRDNGRLQTKPTAQGNDTMSDKKNATADDRYEHMDFSRITENSLRLSALETDPIIAGRPPRVELIQPADNPEPLPLPETAQAPNRQPTIWLLIALAFVVWAVCMLGGCES